MKMFKYIYILFIISLITSAAIASDQPIEVTADQALEWNRANNTFIAKGNAIVTQGDSSITAPTITAHYQNINGTTIIQKITALPNASLKQPNETLQSHSITAQFEGGLLKTIEADKNVILKTDKETLYGDQAIYHAQDRKVIMTGAVRIEQDRNILTGNRAEFDLNTNISTLTANSTTSENNGRVKAVFFPSQSGEQ